MTAEQAVQSENYAGFDFANVWEAHDGEMSPTFKGGSTGGTGSAGETGGAVKPGAHVDGIPNTGSLVLVRNDGSEMNTESNEVGVIPPQPGTIHVYHYIIDTTTPVPVKDAGTLTQWDSTDIIGRDYNAGGQIPEGKLDGYTYVYHTGSPEIGKYTTTDANIYYYYQRIPVTPTRPSKSVSNLIYDDELTYTVTGYIPATVAESYTTVELRDELPDAFVTDADGNLEGSFTLTIGDEISTQAPTVDKTKVVYSFTDLAAVAGKNLKLVITVKIDPEKIDETFPVIYNTGKLAYYGTSGSGSYPSDTVGSVPKPTKLVNGVTDVTLQNDTDPIVYTVDFWLPTQIDRAAIKDSIDPNLKVNSWKLEKYNWDETELTEIAASTPGEELGNELNIAVPDARQMWASIKYRLTVNAELAAELTTQEKADIINSGDIPNTATLIINDTQEADSNTVYVRFPISGTIGFVAAKAANAAYQAGDFSAKLESMTTNDGGETVYTEVETVPVDANGVFRFSEIDYEASGTYLYRITEVAGDLNNWSYDKSAYVIKVEIKTDGTYTQTITKQTEGQAAAEASGVVFTNTYKQKTPHTTERTPGGETKTSPDTGDTMSMPFWMLVLGISAAAIGIMTVSSKKNKKKAK